MTLRASTTFAALVLSAAIAGMAAPVAAQQPAPVPWPVEKQPGAAPKAQQPAAQPKAQPKAQPAPKPKDETAAAPARSNEGALRQRVEQLEEQLADMQVMIGTLESLGKGGGAAAAPGPVRPGTPTGGGGGGVDQARMESLETQMRALASQVEQLTTEMRRRGAAPVDAPQVVRQASAEPAGRPQTSAAPSGFGSTIVTPGNDPIGRVLTDQQAGSAPAGAPLPSDAQAATSAKQLYETSYAYLLQQDYPAAEVSFEEFLRRHPGDRQAADAQYWYAETLYVQRRYKPAGQAFLKVIEKHQASSKVPNSILKLAMSLEQLGQKDCALFAEIETKHPNATNDVKTKARALKQRVGC